MSTLLLGGRGGGGSPFSVSGAKTILPGALSDGRTASGV